MKLIKKICNYCNKTYKAIPYDNNYCSYICFKNDFLYVKTDEMEIK